MARRFVRSVRLDRGNEVEIDAATEQFRAMLEMLIEQHLRQGGWKCLGRTEGNVTGIVVSRGGLEGRVDADRTADVIMIPGQGSRRTVCIRIAVECVNAKREKARALKWGMFNRFGSLFGILGAVVAGLGWAVVENAAIGVVHVRIVVLTGFIGFGIGAAIGCMVGEKVGGAMGAGLNHSAAGEEDSANEAGAAWETFVAEVAESVAAAAEPLEETPSAATLI